jgi:predicted acetyltransferase
MSTVTNHSRSTTTATSTTAPTVTWVAEQAGLWVARRDGEFVGMVEARWGSGFACTTRLAKPLGTFVTVEEAQRALEDSLQN